MPHRQGAGGCSLRIKCQNPDVQIKVKFQAIGNLRYSTINGSVWTCAWTASPVWPPQLRPSLTGRRAIPDGLKWFCSFGFVTDRHRGALAVRGSRVCKKKRERREDFTVKYVFICNLNMQVSVFFPFVEVGLQGEVGYGGKEGNPFMYYQMFPFRNPRLFSILSLKRMCSRLYPARQN